MTEFWETRHRNWLDQYISFKISYFYMYPMKSLSWEENETLIKESEWRVKNALNPRSVLNTVNSPLYTMVGHFAACVPITHWWATFRPCAPIHTDGLLWGHWPHYTMMATYIRYLVHFWDLMHSLYS